MTSVYKGRLHGEEKHTTNLNRKERDNKSTLSCNPRIFRVTKEPTKWKNQCV